MEEQDMYDCLSIGVPAIILFFAAGFVVGWSTCARVFASEIKRKKEQLDLWFREKR